MPASVQDQDESSRANGEDHHVSAQRGLWILGSL
ncbi:MAG: hypothetical protein RJB68_968, partial [Pseudomonadota bacterium]